MGESGSGMTAPLRDDAGRFIVDHGALPDCAAAPRDGYHLRYDPVVEAARRELREALAWFLPATPACADDPDGWYASSDRWSQTQTSARRLAHAVASCAVCPIRPECGAVGEHERHGIWGGINRERGTHPERAARSAAA